MPKTFSADADIFRQFERMCSSHNGKCDGCKMTSLRIRDKDYCEWLLKVNPSKHEKIVEEWADKHPETVKLTWYDAITMLMLRDIANGKIKTPITVSEYLNMPVSADIVEKLAVQTQTIRRTR